jgi:hypothetical protein
MKRDIFSDAVDAANAETATMMEGRGQKRASECMSQLDGEQARVKHGEMVALLSLSEEPDHEDSVAVVRSQQEFIEESSEVEGAVRSKRTRSAVAAQELEELWGSVVEESVEESLLLPASPERATDAQWNALRPLQPTARQVCGLCGSLDLVPVTAVWSRLPSERPQCLDCYFRALGETLPYGGLPPLHSVLF